MVSMCVCTCRLATLLDLLVIIDSYTLEHHQSCPFDRTLHSSSLSPVHLTPTSPRSRHHGPLSYPSLRTSPHPILRPFNHRNPIHPNHLLPRLPTRRHLKFGRFHPFHSIRHGPRLEPTFHLALRVRGQSIFPLVIVGYETDLPGPSGGDQDVERTSDGMEVLDVGQGRRVDGSGRMGGMGVEEYQPECEGW
jgi:hypothetical protein